MAQRDNSVCHLATCPQQLWSQSCGATTRGKLIPVTACWPGPTLDSLVCVIASLFLMVWILMDKLAPIPAPPLTLPISLHSTKLKTKENYNLSVKDSLPFLGLFVLCE